MTAPATVPLKIVNDTGQDQTDVWLAVIGLDAAGDWAYVKADGTTAKFTTGTNDYLLQLSSLSPKGVADHLTAFSTTGKLTLPQLVSGQIYFSVGSKLVIGTNSDPSQPGGVGLQLPAGWVSTDPNYDVMYDYVEFTFDGGGLNCDMTQVDAFGLPISMEITGDNGTQSAGGWTLGRSALFTAFQMNSQYAKLALVNGTTQLRILNPSHGIDLGLFPKDFLDKYIAEQWKAYQAPTPLNINIASGQYQGTYLGTTTGANTPMQITLNGTSVGSIGYPTTSEAFYCNGVFDQGNTAMGAVANVVVTAINRGILGKSPQPDCTVSDFYPAGGTYNGYAQLLHSAAANGLCYAFAYDDQCNQSSDISDGNPTSWTITLQSLA